MQKHRRYYHAWLLKNLVDSEQLMRQFDALGYKVRHDAENPDGEIVVVVRGFIGDAKEEINTILNWQNEKRRSPNCL